MRVDDELVLEAASCGERVQKYKRLRAVEVALCGKLHDMVTDAALNFSARSVGLRERGESLYEHGDYSVLLELATSGEIPHHPGGQLLSNGGDSRHHRQIAPYVQCHDGSPTGVDLTGHLPGECQLGSRGGGVK